MIDLATVHAAFPELTALVPLAASGQRDVLRGQQAGTEIVSKIVRAASPDAEARILREVEAVSALAANYIPTIYSFGRRLLGTEERLFIIEQYTPGETYRQVLQREPLQSLAKVLSLGDVLWTCPGFVDTWVKLPALRVPAVARTLGG